MCVSGPAGPVIEPVLTLVRSGYLETGEPVPLHARMNSSVLLAETKPNTEPSGSGRARVPASRPPFRRADGPGQPIRDVAGRPGRGGGALAKMP